MKKKHGVIALIAVASLCIFGVTHRYVTDTQIGMHVRGPIRQMEVFKPGDPFIYAGDTPLVFTKVSLYLRYIDKNNDGCFTREDDEVVWRSPRSDPPFYYDGEPLAQQD